MSSNGFFLTKKQKKQLKERRKKKKLAEQGKLNGVKENESTATTMEEPKDIETKQDPRSCDNASPTATTTPPDNGDSTKITGKRKREDYIIYIPDDIYNDPKAAKKVRKDARRNAKAKGMDETKLKFRQESYRKPTRTFPCLKELAAQTKTTILEKAKDESPVTVDTSKYVALDCEMVGIGTDGKRSVLARASLVDWDGNCIFDEYVRVPVKVTDYRTKYSGIRPNHLKGNNAIQPTECRNRIAELICDKILVGHALHNDLTVLMLQHQDVRDTGKYRPFQRIALNGKYRPRKLRDLVLEHLGTTIQTGSHDSVQDAASTMELFKSVHREWEQEIVLQTKQHQNRKRKKS